MIRFTHTRIPLEHLKEALNGDIAGWKVEGDVAIIQDKDNRKTPFKTAERLDIKGDFLSTGYMRFFIDISW